MSTLGHTFKDISPDWWSKVDWILVFLCTFQNFVNPEHFQRYASSTLISLIYLSAHLFIKVSRLVKLSWYYHTFTKLLYDCLMIFSDFSAEILTVDTRVISIFQNLCTYYYFTSPDLKNKHLTIKIHFLVKLAQTKN